MKLTDLYFSIFHKIQIIYYLLIVYKFFFSETSCDFNECIQGCQYVKIGLNQGCSEACNKNQTFQKNTTCVDLCKKTSQQFMTSIIGRDLFLLAFLGFICESCHIRRVEIGVEYWNFCRILNVYFLLIFKWKKTTIEFCTLGHLQAIKLQKLNKNYFYFF